MQGIGQVTEQFISAYISFRQFIRYQKANCLIRILTQTWQDNGLNQKELALGMLAGIVGIDNRLTKKI